MYGGCDQRSVASTWMRTFTRAESWKDIYFYYTTFARCLQYFLWFSIENLNLNQFILHSLPASLGWQTKLERIQPSKAIYRIFPPVPTQTPTINYLFLQSLGNPSKKKGGKFHTWGGSGPNNFPLFFKK